MKKILSEKTRSSKKPSNLDECLKELSYLVESYDSNKFLNDKDIITKLHFGLGMNIRNEWGMWDDSSDLYKWFSRNGIFHPDDMSSIVFESFIRKLKKEPIDFEGQVKFYQEYWKKKQ